MTAIADTLVYKPPQDHSQMVLQLNELAKPDDTGRLWVRTAAALRVLGYLPSHGPTVARRYGVEVKRYCVPWHPQAPSCRVTVWSLESCLRLAKSRADRLFRQWTEEEDDLLLQMMDEGMSLEEMARRLYRSARAIRRRGTTIGLNRRNCSDGFTIYALAQELDCHARTIDLWIRDKGLAVRRIDDGHHTRLIRPADLIRFFERHPHLPRKLSERRRQYLIGRGLYPKHAGGGV